MSYCGIPIFPLISRSTPGRGCEGGGGGADGGHFLCTCVCIANQRLVVFYTFWIPTACQMSTQHTEFQVVVTILSIVNTNITSTKQRKKPNKQPKRTSNADVATHTDASNGYIRIAVFFSDQTPQHVISTTSNMLNIMLVHDHPNDTCHMNPRSVQ